MYAKQKLSLEEIALEFKISRCAVTRELRSRGIKIRERGENIRRKRGLKYGKKIRNKEVVKFKKEAEVIEKIKDLREKGFSYHRIADILNSMKVPTKTSKLKWYAKVVYEILNREFS